MLKTIIWCAKKTAGGANESSSIMVVHLKQADKRIAANAFSLIEVLVAFVILSLVLSGLMYGYVQANRMAEYSSMSLAAQSAASQGLEQVRSCEWNSLAYPPTNGPGTSDECSLTTNSSGAVTPWVNIDTLDVPSTGSQIPVTNYVTITSVSANPPVRQISSVAYWTFPLTGTLYSNFVFTLRAPDQ